MFRMVTRRRYVLPGDLIVEGDYYPGPNTYALGKKIYSSKVGVAEISGSNVRVVPIEGKYIPKQGDLVVGIVTDYNILSWTVDINSIFAGYLLVKDVLSRFSIKRIVEDQTIRVGDVIAAKILAFDLSRDPLLTIRGPGLGKIPEGELVRISPTKVYRLIDKKDQLAKMIEEATKCKLIIGMNGLIVVRGPPEGIFLAVKAIRFIESESHIEGLTRNVREMLTSRG